VPLLDLHRQYLQVQDEVLAGIERICASQQYILRAEVEGLERELANFCGAGDAVGCASGTDALWLALAAAGVQPGDQVLTTPFSFFAPASAIVPAGARPVFADIDPRLSRTIAPTQSALTITVRFTVIEMDWLPLRTSTWIIPLSASGCLLVTTT
jgi:dTDP-4-amino-4,6-dideoxygalactose transaminase